MRNKADLALQSVVVHGFYRVLHFFDETSYVRRRSTTEIRAVDNKAGVLFGHLGKSYGVSLESDRLYHASCKIVYRALKYTAGAGVFQGSSSRQS